MKKILTLTITAAIALSLAGCAEKSKDKVAADLTITHELGTTEVPFNPKKIAVLDLAALDILDSLGLGGRVAGIPKASSVSYLKSYIDNENIVNLGSVKEVDMEALHALEPDLIFIGSRLAGDYESISKIAPAICLSIDNEKGYMISFKENISSFASIFGLEEAAEKVVSDLDSRIRALNTAASGKTAIIAMVTSGSLSTLGDGTRGSVIGNEIGFKNVAGDVNSTHGDTASFELLLEKNPDYIFVLDRDTAINAEGAKVAKEVLENEIVMKTNAYQNNTIVYLTPDVWYLAEGGITAADIMLKDLEHVILQ